MNKLTATNKDITVIRYSDDDLWKVDIKNGNHKPLYFTLEEIKESSYLFWQIMEGDIDFK